MARKTRHLGQESGKSSNRWFTSNGQQVGNPRGHGASTGDGQTSNPSILGKIAVVFRPGKSK